jgi:hypothetical protein
MQRIAQREKAFHATIMPNSNSESSTLRGETRCDEETMPRVRAFGFAPAFAWARGSFTLRLSRNVDNL